MSEKLKIFSVENTTVVDGGLIIFKYTGGEKQLTTCLIEVENYLTALELRTLLSELFNKEK